jgi:hypothetical protein
VINFVRAESLIEALWLYIVNENDSATRLADGSVKDGSIYYTHPLAYIEAMYKIPQGVCEWQIREMPEWAWNDPYNEIFCGESSDGPTEVIAACRKQLLQEIPYSRAKAFLWYLKGGKTLVSFYRKAKPFQITILKRYLYEWDGKNELIDEWSGTYGELVNLLNIEIIHLPLRQRM